MGLFLWTIADVASLFLSDSVFARQLFAWLWIDPADHLTPASTSSWSSSSSSASFLPAPSSFLMAARVTPYFQSLPYTIAATTVILAAVGAAIYGQNQMRL
ncbi:hypothetical protein M407DRAFT_247118, partial [Tulasnella calospora MUT 4182]